MTDPLDSEVISLLTRLARVSSSAWQADALDALSNQTTLVKMAILDAASDEEAKQLIDEYISRKKSAAPPTTALTPGAGVQQLNKLLAPLQTLPASTAELRAFFEDTNDLKVPVSPIFVEAYKSMDSNVVQLLEAAGYSVTTLALQELVSISDESAGSSEQGTCSIRINPFLTKAFGIFQKHGPVSARLSYKLLLNQTESGTIMRSTARLSRPDFLIQVKGIVAGGGEDKKFGNMEAAKADLKDKFLGLPAIVRGSADYLVAYTAAGAQVQWHKVSFYHGDQVTLEELTPELDMSTPADRARLVIAVAKVFALLNAVERVLPPVCGSFPHGTRMKRGGPGDVTITFSMTNAVKVVKNCAALTEYHSNSVTTIKAAYEVATAKAALQAAKGHAPYMVPGTVEKQTTNKRKQSDAPLCESLVITTTVLGYTAVVQSEEEAKGVIWAALKTIQAFEEQRLVWRDVRMANIVRHIDNRGWMTVDYETVAKPGKQKDKYELTDWQPGTLREDVYDTSSDLYQVGRLLQTLQDSKSVLAQDLVLGLLGRRLGTQAALDHAWLQGVEDQWQL
mmetsp:Transcript_2855/g.6259  ORF Transcript_2855/g.6259 Transcript_2855/m.6259 type:complete len:565 (+) Transcript_2855:254-1948(+)